MFTIARLFQAIDSARAKNQAVVPHQSGSSHENSPAVVGIAAESTEIPPINMSRERDPYRIPRAGWEIAPTAGVASVDLNGNHGALTGGEFIG